jgi:hypothetical protein
MLRSNDWRDYTDATGVYHFLTGEFDYFLALQAVDAKDVARFYLSVDERTELATAMDRSRAGDADYRRTLEELALAIPHAAKTFNDYWTRFGWGATKHPVGARALARVRHGSTAEEHARRERIKRLKQLRDGWRERVAAVVAAADGFSREEIFAAIDALRQLATKARKLTDERAEWLEDAESLDWSEVECAKRWNVSRPAARMRLGRLRR